MLDVQCAIGEVLARGDAVVDPATPVARRLAALLAQGDVPIPDLARLACADPGMASRVLAAAAARTSRRAPRSLPRAIELIGHAGLLRIARDAARSPDPGEPGPFAALRAAAWQEALGAAMVARGLARVRGRDGEAAWTAGLLHDVGRLAAISAVEKLAAGARSGIASPGRAWERLAERWHVSLGLSIAARLRFPRSVADAIALHHADGLDRRRSPEIVRIVRTAGALVRLLWDRPAEEDDRLLEDLTDAEASRLSPLVVALPGAVAALERPPVPAGRGAAAQERRGPPPDVLHESKGAGVRLRIAGREYTAFGVGPHQLHVTGPAPLGEGALLEIELIERRGLAFHARVLLAWPDGEERFGAIVMPFALSGPAILDWQGSVPVGANA